MAGAIPDVSAPLLGLFSRYVERYLRRHFHAVRLAGSAPAVPDHEPLVAYLNHPSWWDPLIGLVVARRLFPGRRHYAPIDQAALGRYSFFSKLGAFGVEQRTSAGARRFLETATAIASAPGCVLWITPQGGFVDPRERPLRFAPGLAHLVRRLQRGTLLPIAIELPFWTERLPEALVRVGEPVPIVAVRGLPVATLQRLLAGRLEETADALAGAARRRDEDAFATILGGAAGVGGVYDVWRRLRSRLRGERFSAEHAALLHGGAEAKTHGERRRPPARPRAAEEVET